MIGSFLTLEPNFVSMTWVPESEQSKDGDDDKVYLFFSETAVEFDSYNKLVVPRVARVCKVTVASSAALFLPFPLPDHASRFSLFVSFSLQCNGLFMCP